MVKCSKRFNSASTSGAIGIHPSQPFGKKFSSGRLIIPILPSLRQELDLQPQADGHLTFLVTEQGKPFTAAGFGNWFRDRCDEAGLPNCAAHGLRSAAATRLADQGATAHQLMAWFGWRTLSEAERYTQEANRKRLAASAGQLISGTGIGKPEIQFAKTASKSLKSRKAIP